MAHMQFEPLCIASPKDAHEFVGLGNQYLAHKDFASLGGDASPLYQHGMIGDHGSKTSDRIAMIEEEAYEKGFAQGEKDGFEIGEQKGARAAEQIETVLTEIQHLKKDIVRRAEKELLGIIFQIAEKIVHTQLKDDTNAISDTILQAIHLAAEKSEITLRVNPDDYDLVEKLRPEIFKRIRELKTMTVTSDKSVTRGGCLLETARGNVDARIETQLKKISEAIEGAYLEENAG